MNRLYSRFLETYRSYLNWRLQGTEVSLKKAWQYFNKNPVEGAEDDILNAMDRKSNFSSLLSIVNRRLQNAD